MNTLFNDSEYEMAWTDWTPMYKSGDWNTGMKGWIGLYEIRYTGMSHETFYVGASGLQSGARDLWRRWRDYVLFLKNYNLKCYDNVMPMVRFIKYCLENNLNYEEERKHLQIRWYPMFQCTSWSKENAEMISEKEVARRNEYGNLPGHGTLPDEEVNAIIESLNEEKTSSVIPEMNALA